MLQPGKLNFHIIIERNKLSQEQRKNKFLCYRLGKINSHTSLDVSTSFTTQEQKKNKFPYTLDVPTSFITSDRNTCHIYQQGKK